MAVPPSTINAPFPRDEKEFGQDPRISFSKLDETYILEAEDETEYEWDVRAKRWIPVVDEALLEQQQAAYKVPGEEEEAPDPKSRKRDAQDDSLEAPSKKKKKPEKQKQPTERKNRAVYITQLPLDATVNELETTFSKYGLIADSIDDSSKRIKLYKDENGDFKGDALVVYFRPESVQLAIQMLDDTEFRLGSGQGTIKVQEASMEFKSQKETPATTNDREKKRIIKKLQKQNNRLADWSSDEDVASAAVQPSKWDKVVILSHMFTLSELAEDPSAILDIKADIREECEKLGDVTNVVLYDLEEEGIVSVRFKDEVAARKCVQVMDGRFFGGVRCEAGIARGNEKFKKSGKENIDDEEDDSDEKGRLEKFGTWLEGEKKAQ